MSQWEPIVSNALGSAAAGIVSRSLTHPLDTVKARLQFGGDVYKGPIDVLRKTYSVEGIRGLYRGFRWVHGIVCFVWQRRREQFHLTSIGTRFWILDGNVIG